MTNELLRVESARNLTPTAPTAHAGSDRSALDDLLERARAHERIGGLISPFLFRTALVADIGLLVMLLIGSQLNGHGVSHSSFFLVGGGLVAGMIGLMQALTWPLLAMALAGLALKLWTHNRRTPEAVHVFCAAESVAALATGFGWLLVVAMFVIELVLWMVIIAAITALVVGILVSLLGAAGS